MLCLAAKHFVTYGADSYQGIVSRDVYGSAYGALRSFGIHVRKEVI